MLKTAADIDLLYGAGLIKDPKLMHRKIVRLNTRNMYTQKKFNLMREETEGFSKVLSLLNSNVTVENVPVVKKDLVALIGYFELDPNRVFDHVLEVFEGNIDNDCYLDIISLFKLANLPHILGFKFQYYQREETMLKNEKTPESLYVLAAKLIVKEKCSLEEIIPHLLPTANDIVAENEKYIAAIRKQAASFSITKLNGSVDEKKDQTEESEFVAHNQLYGIIQGLFQIGSWDKALTVMECFQRENVNPVDHDGIATALCKLVQQYSAKVYHDVCNQHISLTSTTNTKNLANYVQPVKDINEFITVVFPMLELLGHQMHQDIRLFTIVCRIMQHLLTQNKDLADQHKDKIDTIIATCILPSLSMTSCNPGAVYDVWMILQPMEFNQRYSLYFRWNQQYTSHQLTLKKAMTISDTRKILRRLTSDNVKQISRQLLAVVHSNPLIVFNTILGQIEAYDNLVVPVVDSMRYLTAMGMDVLSFALICNVSSERNKMKLDGANTSLWITSLAQFSGNIYRKFPNIELVGLLRYIVERLKSNESVDLLILAELLSKMGSCLALEDISVDQLEARAGGPTLGMETIDAALVNHRAIPKLRDALVKTDLLVPLITLIGQQRNYIEHQATPPHLKLVGRLYDDCQMTLNQLVEFMSSSVDPQVLHDMLPSLPDLCLKYHLPVEVAFTTCRPIIRASDEILFEGPRGCNLKATKKITSDWSPLSESFLAAVALVYPNEVLSQLTATLVSTFWSLCLYDIYVPFTRYDTEVSRLRNQFIALNQSNSASDSNSKTGRSDIKKQEKKLTTLIDTILNEQKDQASHRKRIFQRLETQKPTFIVVLPDSQNTFTVHYLQSCVIPRAVISPQDAMFAAKFSEHLHNISTPGFSSVNYYHTVNMSVPPMVACVTEREANNLGTFMNETLKLLHRWYTSSKDYKKEALNGRIGFSADMSDATKLIPHGGYSKMYLNWQKSMATAFLSNLESEEYMAIRNSLIMLIKITDVFPATSKLVVKMTPVIEKLTHEDREDLKIMARRYTALLKKKKSTLSGDTSTEGRKEPSIYKEDSRIKSRSPDAGNRGNQASSRGSAREAAAARMSARDVAANAASKSPVASGNNNRANEESDKRGRKRERVSDVQTTEAGEIPAKKKTALSKPNDSSKSVPDSSNRGNIVSLV